MYKKKYFESKMREPYMGGTIRVRVELKIFESGEVEVWLVNPEGIRYLTRETTEQVFNE
ncbi:hypothetical protein LCGC14_0251430 [marine sediment metagenome]|uniref:Uncharacterized protein n=1 Tax=marine sediment metagenome TaxID=412755 RepID=A0A0F9WPG7_9ZZZZ